MQRRLTLSKNAYLWEEGDQARNIAVVERGKLAVRSGGDVVGIVLPKMVVGEAAINGDGKGSGGSHRNGDGHRRSASAVAIEDDTIVVEYAPSRIKDAYDNAEPAVGQQILITLMGQTSRNLLMVLTSGDVHPLTVSPVKGLISGMAGSLAALHEIKDWKSFLTAFQVLTSFRDASEHLRRSLITEVNGDALERATATMKEHFSGTDILPTLEEFFQAEKERAEWLEP
jgi:CRP-like cAMP-binding protein